MRNTVRFLAAWAIGASATTLPAQDSLADKCVKPGDPACPAESKPTVSTPAADTVRGRVFDMDGRPRGGMAVSLNAVARGDTLIWRAISVTDSSGRFEFVYTTRATTSPAVFRLDIDRQRITVDTLFGIDQHKWIENVRLEWKPDASLAGLRRLDLKLRYDVAPPLYTFLLFLPALVGLLMAAVVGGLGLNSNGNSQGRLRKLVNGLGARLMRKRRIPAPSLSSATSSPPPAVPPTTDSNDDSDLATNLYVYAGSVVWVVIVGGFALGFVFSDLQAINLFGPTMRVPVIVPVAAFLGVLVFATTQLLKLTKEGKTPEQRATLLELGNRVFIAPYVAIVAVLALPENRSIATAALVAFVTGLWIDPVLETIRTLTETLLPGKAKSTTQTTVATAGATGGVKTGAGPASAKAPPVPNGKTQQARGVVPKVQQPRPQSTSRPEAVPEDVRNRISRDAALAEAAAPKSLAEAAGSGDATDGSGANVVGSKQNGGGPNESPP